MLSFFLHFQPKSRRRRGGRGCHFSYQERRLGCPVRVRTEWKGYKNSWRGCNWAKFTIANRHWFITLEYFFPPFADGPPIPISASARELLLSQPLRARQPRQLGQGGAWGGEAAASRLPRRGVHGILMRFSGGSRNRRRRRRGGRSRQSYSDYWPLFPEDEERERKKDEREDFEWDRKEEETKIVWEWEAPLGLQLCPYRSSLQHLLPYVIINKNEFDLRTVF